MKLSLLPKMVISNFVGFALVAYLYLTGVLVPAFTSDESHMALIIAGTLLLGILANFWFAYKLTYNKARIHPEVFRIKFEFVQDIGNYLVTLGLIGTAIGLLIAVRGIDWASLASAEGISSLGAGMTTLTYNTILGGAAWIWHSINTRAINTRIELMNYE